MSGKIVSAKEIEKFGNTFSLFVVNLFMTFLLWLFGVAIFLPLTYVIQASPSLQPIVGAIFLTSTAYLAGKTVWEGKHVLDSYHSIVLKRSGDRTAKSGLIFKSKGHVVLVFLAAITMVPFAWSINPVFGGIFLTTNVLACFLLAVPLFQGFFEKLTLRTRKPKK